VSEQEIRKLWLEAEGSTTVPSGIFAFARAVEQASRRAALEEAKALASDHAEECPSLAGRVETRLIASKLHERALATDNDTTNTGADHGM
jgi:hypothetical protein